MAARTSGFQSGDGAGVALPGHPAYVCVLHRPARAMMKMQEGAGSLLLFITPLLLPQSFASEISVVTCGSAVKLLNTKHNVRLHSHDVRYGSGKERGDVIPSAVYKCHSLMSLTDSSTITEAVFRRFSARNSA